MSKSRKHSYAKKTPATVRAGAKKTAKSAVVMSQERKQMISEAAYYIAEHRGFGSADELGDWLQAESQINVALSQKGG